MTARAKLLDMAARVEGAEAHMQAHLILEAVELAKTQGWITVRRASDALRMMMVDGYESAAMTLVPEEWAVGLEQALSGTPWHADVRSNGVVNAVAATPALALTAAALRARAEEVGDE